MKLRKAVLLGIFTVMIAVAANAQAPETVDIRTVTHPANDAEKAFVRAAIDGQGNAHSGFRTEGLENNFNFPPFVGAALEIISTPNFFPGRIAYLAVGGVTISGCISTRATFPSGDSAELTTLCFNQPLSLQDSNYRVPVWNGELMQSGVTTFKVFNVDVSGRVSVVSAQTVYASNYFSQNVFIGLIGVSSDGSVIVNGTFDTIAIAGNVTRNLSFISGAVLAKTFPLSPGDYTVTGCLRGTCATRIFHFDGQGGGQVGKGNTGLPAQ